MGHAELFNIDTEKPIINLQTADLRDVDSDRLILRCTCYMVYCDKIYDLLNNKIGQKQ